MRTATLLPVVALLASSATAAPWGNGGGSSGGSGLPSWLTSIGNGGPDNTDTSGSGSNTGPNFNPFGQMNEIQFQDMMKWFRQQWGNGNGNTQGGQQQQQQQSTTQEQQQQQSTTQEQQQQQSTTQEQQQQQQPTTQQQQQPQQPTTTSKAPVTTDSPQSNQAENQTPQSNQAENQTPQSNQAASNVALPPPLGGTVTGSPSHQQAILDAHNKLRAAHSASPLAWNQTLADRAAAWGTKCDFSHFTEGYGQNLAIQAPPRDSAAGQVQGWADEVQLMTWPATFNHDTFPKIGHFTQMVWKDTTTVGCSWTHCGKTVKHVDFGMESVYLVCNYYPPGNNAGLFGQQVSEN